MTDTAALAASALLVAAASGWDIGKRIIPNRLTVLAALAGIGYQGIVHGPAGLLWSLSGAATGFGVLLVLYVLKGIGAGDVKLFGALGAWVGPGMILQTAMYAVLLAGAVGLVWALASRWRIRGISFPFMIAVLPAYAAAAASESGWL